MKTLVLLALLITVFASSKAQYQEFSVEVIGSGQPILLFPGFACPGDVWEETVVELSKNYQCHVFTFAGFGEVPPLSFPWFPKVEAAVLDYIHKESLKNPKLIGHSLGGTLALSLASKAAIFDELVIVDALTATGALFFPDYKSENMVYDSPYNNNLLAMGDDDFKGMAQQMASGMTLNKEKQGQLVDWMLKADRETYVYGYTDYLKVDLREAVGQIKSPVTILAATNPFRKEAAKKTYESQYTNLKDYTLTFAEGAAHFIMYDKPEWFLKEITRALSSNE